jgi:hypothetical protein
VRVIDIIEGVIDRSEQFRQQRLQSFRDRLARAGEAATRAFVQQEMQEKVVNSKLAEIEHLPNKLIGSQALLDLAALRSQYLPNTSIVNILSWDSDADTADSPERMVQQARDFVQHNRDKILDIIETQLRALDELAQWADQQQWPAPWRSYTRYGSIKLEIERNREYFKRYQ